MKVVDPEQESHFAAAIVNVCRATAATARGTVDTLHWLASPSD